MRTTESSSSYTQNCRDDPGAELRGAVLDSFSLARLLAHAPYVSGYLASVAVANDISAEEFSALSIPEMSNRVSGLLYEVGDLLHSGGSSFVWLGPLSDMEGRDGESLTIPENIVRERKMLDRCYVALSLPTADSSPQGRRLLGCELAEQFPSCFGDEEYPDDDWAFFDITTFSRSQKESMALWFSLQTLQIVARVVGNPGFARWTGDVLRAIDQRVKECVLGGRL